MISCTLRCLLITIDQSELVIPPAFPLLQMSLLRAHFQLKISGKLDDD